MMKKFVLGGMVVVAALLGNACGGDSSRYSPAGPANSEATLSSSSDDVVSSSAKKVEPSSSSIENKGLSSSSSKIVVSSSSSILPQKEISSSSNVASSKEEYYTLYDDTTRYTITCGPQKYIVKGTNCRSNIECHKDSTSSGQTCIRQKSNCSVQGNYFSSECCEQWKNSYTYKYSIKKNIKYCEYTLVSSSSSIVAYITSSSSINRSSSSTLKFDWSVSKDVYLNPEIQYDSIVDERDGKIYKTVKIGNQEWMAENLNYSNNIISEYSTCYKNDSTKCKVAGRLYNWLAAIDSVTLNDAGTDFVCGNGKKCDLSTKKQGICPKGWHLPSQEEWTVLINEVGGVTGKLSAGSALKSKEGWYSCNVNTCGSNRFGFSALPAGESYARTSSGEGIETSFWSVSETEDHYAYRVNITRGNYADLNGCSKQFMFSIRCVKNQE